MKDLETGIQVFFLIPALGVELTKKNRNKMSIFFLVLVKRAQRCPFQEKYLKLVLEGSFKHLQILYFFK